MEVILLRNVIVRGNRFTAGSTICADEEMAKQLIDGGLAVAVQKVEAEPAVVKPAARTSTRRTAKRVAK